MVVPVVLFVVAALVVAVGLLRGPRPLVVAGLLIAVAGGLFLVVLADAALDTADEPVLAWLVAHRAPGWTATAETLSLLGGTVGTGGLAAVAAVVLAVRGRWRTAAVWVVGVAVGSLTIRLLKQTVERPRPPVLTRLAVETSTSLPSGHALMAALGLGLTAVAVGRLVRSPAVGVVALVVAVVLAGAIGASRAYLGVHWTTDVTAGWCLGAALAIICAAVASRVDERAPTARPVSAAARR